PISLPKGKPVNTSVPAEHLSRPIYHVTATKLVFTREGFHQHLIIAETNILALQTIGDRETQCSRQFSHVALVHFTEREQRMSQLVVTEREEKIGLVLGAIRAAQKRSPPVPFFSNNPRIVARGDIIKPMFFGPFEQRTELEIPVAGNARVWCASAEVIFCERAYHRIGKLAAQIDQCIRYAQLGRDILRAAMVRADARPGIAFPHTQ